MSEISDLTDYIVSYGMLIFFATLAIYSGSFASLPKAKRMKEKDPTEEEEEEEGPLSEVIRLEDAYWFPLIGSVVLLSLYLIIRYISVIWLNILLRFYFAATSVASIWTTLLNIFSYFIGHERWKNLSKLSFSLHHDKKELFRVRYPTISLILTPIAFYAPIVYLCFPDIMEHQHTMLIDIMGLSLCHSALSAIKLDSLLTGSVLLSGLFLYDIWWVFGSKPVFGSNVMVTVAQGIDAPIKILWPKSKYMDVSNGFTMLGLGDIVVPGMFIAFALRYDLHRSAHQDRRQAYAKPFFKTTLVSYVLGLITTVVVMHNFQSAQPALLYLSPACLLSFLGIGKWLGVWKEMWAYSDTKEEEKDAQKKKDSKEEKTD